MPAGYGQLQLQQHYYFWVHVHYLLLKICKNGSILLDGCTN